jgi:hypothetical protein
MAASLLAPLTSRAVHLCVDMQRLLAATILSHWRT